MLETKNVQNADVRRNEGPKKRVSVNPREPTDTSCSDTYVPVRHRNGSIDAPNQPIEQLGIQALCERIAAIQSLVSLQCNLIPAITRSEIDNGRQICLRIVTRHHRTTD